MGLSRAALLALLVAAPALSGCFQRRNDPEKRAVAAVAVELALTDAPDIEDGAGRLWLRLMPLDRGEAIEATLEWTLRHGAGKRREALFQPARAGDPPGIGTFEDLRPGRYRLSSFLVSARLGRRGADPLLLTLGGDLPELAPITLAAGELASLGTLALAVSPDEHYEYRAVGADGSGRLAAALARRGDLRGFRPVERPVAGAPELAAAGPLVQVGGGGGGARPRRGADRGERAKAAPAAPPLAPAAAEGAPATGTESAAALGMTVRLAPSLAAEAKDGSGLLRVEVRRVGAGSERSAVEVGWEVDAPPPGSAPDGTARPLKLFGLGAVAGRPEEIVLPLPLAPGEHELVAASLDGTLTIDGKPVRVAARADLSRLASFLVRKGESVDLGVLGVELVEPFAARARPAPAGGDATARAAALGGGLSPVARPLEIAGAHR